MRKAGADAQSQGTRIIAAFHIPGTYSSDRGSGTSRYGRLIVAGTTFLTKWIEEEESTRSCRNLTRYDVNAGFRRQLATSDAASVREAALEWGSHA